MPGELRIVWLLILLYWVAFQIIFYSYIVLANPKASLHPGTVLWRMLLFIVRPSELIICTFGGLICFGLYALVRRLREHHVAVQLTSGLVATLIAAFAFNLSIQLVFLIFDPAVVDANARGFFGNMVLWVAPFGLWTAMSLALAYSMEIRDREARLALVQIQAHEAQVRALRYQVNPHFLYNTLNSISALIIDCRNDDADAMLMRLSAFFRASLANEPTEDVRLRQEIALQRLYLDIELVRFKDSLIIEIDVPDELQDALVPNLLLQPLIENALKHGVNDVGWPTVLRITARRLEERLSLEVSDNGPGGSSQGGTGVGLENVGQRLAARFGDSADVRVRAGPAGFTVQLLFPLVIAEA